MKLSNSQFNILSILWTSDMAMSIRQIADRSKYRFAKEKIVAFILEDLLAKGAARQSGVYRSYAQKKEIVRILYSPAIPFDEYYAQQFENVAACNLFLLLKRLLRSDRLDPQMLYELSQIIDERSGPI